MTFKTWVENNHPEFQESFFSKLGSAISGGISGFKQGWAQEPEQETKPVVKQEPDMDASDTEINRLIQKLEAERKQETKPGGKRYAAEFLLRLFSVKVHEPDAYQQGEQKAAKWKKWQKEIHHALDFAGFDVVYPKRYQQFPNGMASDRGSAWQRSTQNR